MIKKTIVLHALHFKFWDVEGGGGAEEEEGDISLEITKRLGMYHDSWFYNPRITMSLVGIWISNLLTWIVDTDAQQMNATVPSECIQRVFSGGDKSAEGVWKNNGKYLFLALKVN